MRRRRKPIKIWKIIVIFLVLIVAVNAGGNYLISEGNYEKNVVTAVEFNNNNFNNLGYINSTSVLSNFKYSLNQKPENYSIIVATYNALNYLKRASLYNGVVDKTILPSMIRYYDLYAELGFGHLGINPLAVNGYFKSIGLKSEVAFSRENIASNLSSNDVCVLFYTNFKMHEFRAASIRNSTEVNLYAPTAQRNINILVNTTYKDYFLALITINVE